MDKRITTLTVLAQQALEQYKADMAAGSEPVYPQWARDLQDILAAHKLLVGAGQTAKVIFERQKWLDTSTDPEALALRQLRTALAAAGAA